MKRTDEEMQRMGETIDEVVNINLLGRPGIHRVYEEIKSRRAGPMCLSAAKRLVDSVDKGSVVLLSTGFFETPWNDLGETDGPPGVAALARALAVALDARCVVLCEEELVGMLSATCHAAELSVVTDTSRIKELPRTVAVCGFPKENEEAVKESVRLLDELSPAAIICVEKAGENEKGVHHYMSGTGLANMPGWTAARIDRLVEEARSRKILTIGIGDGGNEIGMGNVRDLIEEYIPYGKKCKCPCGAGIAASNQVDSLVVATVSNWGAYGIAAALSLLVENPDVLHSPRVGMKVIEKCVEGGALSAVGGVNIPTADVDGVPAEMQAMVISMLRIIAEKK